MTGTHLLIRYFKADELRNDDRGWAYNLAIFRLVFLGGAVLPFGLATVGWTAQQLPHLPYDAWKPISFYRYLPFEVVTNPTLAYILAISNVVLIGLGFVGFCTRWTLGLATITSLYAFGLLQNQGKVDHFHHVVWFLAMLAVGPSGRFLSVDSLLASIRSADRGSVDPPLSKGTALLTLRFVWVLLGLVYLTPGLSKLEAALTADWATADSLRGVLWLKWLELYLYEPAFGLPPRIDSLPFPLLTLGGLGVILFEVAFILLVLFRSPRLVLAVAGLGFHLGNGFFLHIPFQSLMVAYVCLFDWTAMGQSLCRWLRVRRIVVLYDGSCQLCRRTIALLRSADLFDLLVPVAGLSGDPRRAQFAQISDQMLERDLYSIDGERIAQGYDAYVQIASRIPPLWPLALLMRCPPGPTIGRMVYRGVADSRRCVLPKRPASSSELPGDEARPIRYVGAILLAGQISISMFQFTAEHLAKYLPENHIVQRGFFALNWRLPVWPFDGYPTFANPVRRDMEVWEPRTVSPDGQEVRISARAYAKVFGHPAKCREATDAVRRERNAERHRARSLDLVAVLWPHEEPDIRSRTTTIRIYHARYGLDPSQRQPIAAQLMYEFPVALVSDPKIPDRGSVFSRP